MEYVLGKVTLILFFLSLRCISVVCIHADLVRPNATILLGQLAASEEGRALLPSPNPFSFSCDCDVSCFVILERFFLFQNEIIFLLS